MIILDTNVISELMSPAPADAVVSWVSDQRVSDDLCITSIAVAEIMYGLELLPAGKRRERLLRQAEAMFVEDFADRILSFDERAARMYGTIAAKRRARGRPIAALDAQIAAISRVHAATLATRNVEDFEGCSVPVINPWQEGS